MPAGSTRTPKYIAMDGHGDLWVTEVTGKKLLSVTGIAADAPPTATWVAPRYGAAGDRVTVTGSDLATTRTVTVGGHAATFQVVDPSHLSVTVPAGTGAAPVVVTTDHGTSPPGPGAVFHYGSPPPPPPVVTSVDPPSGPVAGGNAVTIAGQHLSGATIKVGPNPATAVTCTATSCTATVPAGSQHTVDVVATTAAGSSAVSAADQYTYLTPAPAAPAVTAVSPATGPTTGGTSVTVTGTNLTSGSVWFGTAAASGSCTASSCTVRSPQSSAGIVHVRVTTAGGTSPRVNADRYTYVGAGTAASTTTISASPATATVGDDVTLTAHVTPTAASGQVVFRDGSTALGTVDLTAGTAVLHTSSLTVGAHQVSASYLGDETYAGSAASPTTVTITSAPVKQPTTTTLTANPTSTHEGTPVQLTAHVAPTAATGTVTFADDDGTLRQVAVSGGVATVAVSLGAGTHHVTASYGGDAGYEPSGSTPVTVTVAPSVTTTTTLTAAPATAPLQSPVTLTATVSPVAAPGTVSFVDTTTGLLIGSKAVAGGRASLATSALGTGTHRVLASFLSSDPGYRSSGSSLVTVTITAVSPPPPPPPPPPAPGVAPGAPLQVTAKAAPHRKVTVTWAAPASAGSSSITQYVVLVYEGKKVAKTLDTDGSTLKLVVKKLKAGTKYRFAVYAVNGVGSGPTSTETTAVKVRK